MIRPYHDLAAAPEIEGYGGTVEKFIGDAVMAVFGAPVAHEDDAERAVRAGLRILDAIAEANADDPALELQVRIGINTGEAVVSLGARPEHGEGFVTGDVVNTASRLQGVAPVTGSRSARHLRGDGRDLRLRGAGARRPLKGKAEPCRCAGHAARAGSASTSAQAHDAARRPGARARLLTGTFERAVPRPSVSWSPWSASPGSASPGSSRSSSRYVDDARARHVAPGPVPSLRRGHHVLGPRRDREGGRRDPRVRRPPERRAEPRSTGRCRPSDPEARVAAAAAAPLVGLESDSGRRARSLRRLADVPGDRSPADEPLVARLRGPPLGRRGDARVPGGAGRRVGADVPLLVARDRAARAVRAPRRGRRRPPQRGTGSTSRRCRGRDRAAHLRAAGPAVLPAELQRRSSSARAATRSTPRSSSGC